MSQDTATQQAAQPSKWILLGTAVLSALYQYVAIGALWEPVQRYTSPGPYQFLSILLLIAIVLGAGLHWLARRYRTHTVQAGTLVGAGIMTVLIVWDAAVHSRITAFLTIMAVIPLVVVALITANPSPESGESTGITLLWRSLPGVWRRPVENESPDSERTVESTPESNGSTTGSSRGVRRRLSVSRYWLVVGTAFAVAIPIALVNTELGIGLLSAFLTAYALSHRIEKESGNGHDED